MIDNSEHDLTPYTGLGRPPLELLILALIDGAEYKGKLSRRQRLDQAMLALTGSKAAPGPMPDDPYERACRLMAQYEHQDDAARSDYQLRRHLGPTSQLGKDMASEPPRKRNVSELARLAEAEVFASPPGGDVWINNVKRLCDTYTGRYQAKLKGRDSVDHTATYRHAVVEHDYVAESLERQTLEAVARDLAKLGIAMILK